MSNTPPVAGDDARGLIKSPQDLLAGLFLVAFGLFCLWASSNLSLGRGANLGPGSFPRGLSFLLMGIGGIIIVQAFTAIGARLEKWHWMGMVYVLGAVLLFAATVRGMSVGPLALYGVTILPFNISLPSLGLIVAGPLTLIVASLASPERKWIETFIFAAAMTTFCILLFKVALRLPIPVAPWAGW